MKTRKLIIISVTFVAVFVAIAMQMVNSNNTIVSDPGARESVRDDTLEPQTGSGMSVSWATSYRDLESLTKASDFIGLIKIIDVVDVHQIGDEQSPIYLTVYSAKVVKGILADKDTIEIIMTGKQDENSKSELDDDPLMYIGDNWFIFARKNELGSYTILAGPTGRFSYDESRNTITSLSLISNPDSKISNVFGYSLLDANLTDIEAEIRFYLQ